MITASGAQSTSEHAGLFSLGVRSLATFGLLAGHWAIIQILELSSDIAVQSSQLVASRKLSRFSICLQILRRCDLRGQKLKIWHSKVQVYRSNLMTLLAALETVTSQTGVRFKFSFAQDFRTLQDPAENPE